MRGPQVIRALGGVWHRLDHQETPRIGVYIVRNDRNSNGHVVRGDAVLKRGLGLAVLGAVPGLLGAFAVARLLEGILYGVDPADPWIFGGVTLGLGVVALLATAIPARKAARMGSLEALRLQ